MNHVEISDYPGYEIFEDGRVFSKYTNKFLTSKIDRYGYGVYHLRRGKNEFPTAHRLVALAFIPNPNGFQSVNHKDGNKQNNNKDNLEWCSESYNSWHKCNILNEKPIRYGDKQVVAKNTITNEEILFNSESDAAIFFNVSQKTISRKILTKHITPKRCKTQNWLFEFK